MLLTWQVLVNIVYSVHFCVWFAVAGSGYQVADHHWNPGDQSQSDFGPATA